MTPRSTPPGQHLPEGLFHTVADPAAAFTHSSGKLPVASDGGHGAAGLDPKTATPGDYLGAIAREQADARRSPDPKRLAKSLAEEIGRRVEGTENLVAQTQLAQYDKIRGKDHYHVFNPNATGNSDLYLDPQGNPVNKKGKLSHILPKENRSP